MERVVITSGLFLVLAAFGGCDAAEPTTAKPAPSVREFVLDEHVRFVYRDAVHGLRHAPSLDAIPLEQRAATILYAEDDLADAERNQDQEAYVADLLEASAGDTVQAQRMTLRMHFQRSRAADRGAWHAHWVRFAAQEQAQLDRRSERSEASREAKKLLDKIVPRETKPEVRR